jgi:hypothetical protein
MSERSERQVSPSRLLKNHYGRIGKYSSGMLKKAVQQGRSE